MIIDVWNCDISKLIKVNPETDANEVPNNKLIKTYSVIVDFWYDALLFIAEIYSKGTLPEVDWSLFYAHGYQGNCALMLNTCIISLVKFIMHVWINLEAIRYYERADQFKKMINLLKGIENLLKNKNLYPRKLCSQVDLCVMSFSETEQDLLRRISNPVDIIHSYQIPEESQSIIAAPCRRSFQSQISIISKSNSYYNKSYDYITDTIFIINAWIDYLNANNYTEKCPKKYSYPPLTPNNQMVMYFPDAALLIAEQARTQGTSEYK